MSLIAIDPVSLVPPVEPVTGPAPAASHSVPAPTLEGPATDPANITPLAADRLAQQAAVRQATEPLVILEVEARDGNLQAQRLVAKYEAEQAAEDAAAETLAATHASDATAATAVDERADAAAATRKLTDARADEAAATRRVIDARAGEAEATRRLIDARANEAAANRKVIDARADEAAAIKKAHDDRAADTATSRKVVDGRANRDAVTEHRAGEHTEAVVSQRASDAARADVVTAARVTLDEREDASSRARLDITA